MGKKKSQRKDFQQTNFFEGFMERNSFIRKKFIVKKIFSRRTFLKDL